MFDVRKFLVDNFDDPVGLHKFLRRRRVRDVNYQTVYGWFRRSSLPGPWLGRLLVYLHRERGEAADLRPYLK